MKNANRGDEFVLFPQKHLAFLPIKSGGLSLTISAPDLIPVQIAQHGSPFSLVAFAE
jgi:hypothetical protein